MSKKPRVLLYVLCGRERSDWLNPALACSLLHLQDKRFDVTVDFAYDLKPYERARNQCMMNAKHGGYDLLCEVDNDMILPDNFQDILHEVIISGKHVVGLKAGAFADNGSLNVLSCHDNGRVEGDFRRTGIVGSGVLIISSQVWRAIPKGPWFRWLVNEDEWTTRKMSEDVYFCELVQGHGLEVWTHKQAAGHLKTIDLTKVCERMGLDK
ncbi:MAG: hypothetical protein ABSF97_01020 [Candidatus Sulfotelmatobacter sp.]|jgi:hypothetical protein